MEFGLAKLLQPLCREKYVVVFELPSVLNNMQYRDRRWLLEKISDEVLLMIRHKVYFAACSWPPRSWLLLCCSVCWRAWVHGAEISTGLGDVKRWLLQGWAYHCPASAFSIVSPVLLPCDAFVQDLKVLVWFWFKAAPHRGPRKWFPVNSLCLGSVAIDLPLVLIQLYLRMSVLLKWENKTCPHLLFILLIYSKWCSSLLGPSVCWLALTEQSRAELILYGVCLGEMLLFWNMHGFIVAIEVLWSLAWISCVSRLDWYGGIPRVGESDVVEKGGSTRIFCGLA